MLQAKQKNNKFVSYFYELSIIHLLIIHTRLIFLRCIFAKYTIIIQILLILDTENE